MTSLDVTVCLRAICCWLASLVPSSCNILTFTVLTWEDNIPDTLAWYCGCKCKCKCKYKAKWLATMLAREANISSFETGLVSPWPSFTPYSQSLHLCLPLSLLLPWPAWPPLSFILILFHASSSSCSVLIHHHPQPALHAPQSPAWPDTDAAFTRLLCWHTPLWLITSSNSIWHSPHPNISVRILLQHIRKTMTPINHILQSNHNYVKSLVRALHKNSRQLITNVYTISWWMHLYLIWHWLICWIYEQLTKITL